MDFLVSHVVYHIEKTPTIKSASIRKYLEYKARVDVQFSESALEEVIKLIQKLISTAGKTRNERLACLNVDLFFVK